MGVAAVEALLDPKNVGEPYLISVNGTNVSRVSLEAALAKVFV